MKFNTANNTGPNVNPAVVNIIDGNMMLFVLNGIPNKNVKNVNEINDNNITNSEDIYCIIIPAGNCMIKYDNQNTDDMNPICDEVALNSCSNTSEIGATEPRKKNDNTYVNIPNVTIVTLIHFLLGIWYSSLVAKATLQVVKVKCFKNRIQSDTGRDHQTDSFVIKCACIIAYIYIKSYAESESLKSRSHKDKIQWILFQLKNKQHKILTKLFTNIGLTHSLSNLLWHNQYSIFHYCLYLSTIF